MVINYDCITTHSVAAANWRDRASQGQGKGDRQQQEGRDKRGGGRGGVREKEEVEGGRDKRGGDTYNKRGGGKDKEELSEELQQWGWGPNNGDSEKVWGEGEGKQVKEFKQELIMRLVD